MSVRTGGKYGTVDNVRLWEEWREVGGSLRGGESVVALIYISRTGDASACGSQIGGLYTWEFPDNGQRAAPHSLRLLDNLVLAVRPFV